MIGRYGLRAAAHDDKPRPERLQISKISNKPPQFYQVVKLLVRVGWSHPRGTPYDDDILLNDQQGGDQIRSQVMVGSHDMPLELR